MVDLDFQMTLLRRVLLKYSSLISFSEKSIERIRIGAILEFYGKAKFPENLELSRRWYRGLKINSLNCTGCGLCEPECPYELPIVDMLKEAHVLLK